MEFLVVSSSKLKIMMSREEMIKYEIEGDSVDYDNPKVRRSFWRILDVAKEKCGFDSAGDKILIQYYPCKDGCEIFVTKLGLISSGAERTIAKSSKVAMLSVKPMVYRFSSLNSLFSAIRALHGEFCEREPRLYFDEKGDYYIIIEKRCSSLDGSMDLSVLMEFGTELPSNISGYISEHSTKIDFAAISRIANA